MNNTQPLSEEELKFVRTMNKYGWVMDKIGPYTPYGPLMIPDSAEGVNSWEDITKYYMELKKRDNAQD